MWSLRSCIRWEPWSLFSIRKGRIVRFNRACEQVSGYTFAEVKDKYLWDLCVLPEEARALQNPRRAIANGTPGPRTTRPHGWRETAPGD